MHRLFRAPGGVVPAPVVLAVHLDVDVFHERRTEPGIVDAQRGTDVGHQGRDPDARPGERNPLMTRMRLSVPITASIAALSTLGPQPAPAQSPRRSAPITDVAYEVTADSAAVGRRQLGVAMSFRVAGRAPVLLALPAWSPGHYTLLWFARRVARFTAESGGAPLDWRKVDFQTWEIT